MIEEWKDIVIEKNGVIYDYTDLYQVSNYGRVRSLNFKHTGEVRVLRNKVDKNGYLSVMLYKNKKASRFKVHRLVATAFIPNPYNLPVVNHIDENPSNCRVDNLEWCTHRYNVQYSSYKISESLKGHKPTNIKKVICVETGQIFNSMDDANEWCGKKDGVSACCRGEQKTCGGFHWMYYEHYLIEQLIVNK